MIKSNWKKNIKITMKKKDYNKKKCKRKIHLSKLNNKF